MRALGSRRLAWTEIAPPVALVALALTWGRHPGPVGLTIVALLLAAGKDTSTLARDTVFAAVMITCNGIVGLCLLVGAVEFGTTHFNAEGAGAALAAVITLSVTCLVLPNSPPRRRGRSSPGRNWPSWRSPHWRSTRCSW